MPVNTLKELLRLRLGECYQAEQEMLQLLDAVETDTISRLLRDQLRRRRDQTRRHLAAVEKSFELLGTDPPRAASPMVRGFGEERRAFVRELPGPVALESYHVDLLGRAAQYRLAVYDGLVALAADIPEADVRRLLEQCLRDETAAVAWLRQQRGPIIDEVRAPHAERALAAPSA